MFTLRPLLKIFIRICLLQQGPQALPASRLLAIMSVFFYIALGVLLLLQSRSFTEALWVSLVDALFLLAMLVVILKQNQYFLRWPQTVMAVCGSAMLLNVLALPLLYVLANDLMQGWLEQLAVLSYLLIIFWNVVVLGHILRHAISVSMIVGVVMAALYMCMSLLLVAMLLPLNS